MERKEHEIEIEERRRMEMKKNIINDAAKKQDEPVDDSKLVEAMFDFLPDSSSEAPLPARETSVFNVSGCVCEVIQFDNLVLIQCKFKLTLDKKNLINLQIFKLI